MRGYGSWRVTRLLFDFKQNHTLTEGGGIILLVSLSHNMLYYKKAAGLFS